jgi:hypothetical protein
MSKATAGKAIEGTPLDFDDLKQRAATVARMGEEMRASAPPEIAEQFRTVLAAVATSASNLKKGAQTRDVVEPLYGKQNQPAFDKMDKFSGCPR